MSHMDIMALFEWDVGDQKEAELSKQHLKVANKRQTLLPPHA